MIYMALPLAMATLSSCGGGKKPAAAEENALSPADSLISVLADMEKGGKTIFGHHDDPVYGHSWKYDEGRSDVLETSGKYPGMMSWDLGRLELGDTVNLDGVPFDLMRREVLAQNARGGVNTFSWHLYSPGENVDSWNVSDTTIVHRMVNDPAVKALYREQLERLAAWFNSLKTPEGKKWRWFSVLGTSTPAVGSGGEPRTAAWKTIRVFGAKCERFSTVKALTMWCGHIRPTAW